MKCEQDNCSTPTRSRPAKFVCISPNDTNFPDNSIPNYITVVPPKNSKYSTSTSDSKSHLSFNTSIIDTHNEIYDEGIDPIYSHHNSHNYNTSIGFSSYSIEEQEGLQQHQDDINPYNVRSLEEILDGVDPEKYNKMILNYSPRMFKRLHNCGHMLFEFEASEDNGSTYISSQCHSDLCFECIRNDRRTYKRVIDHIGHDLLSNYHWIKLIITIPKDYRHHFLDYDVIDKFTNGMWDLIKNVLNLDATERYDRGGAIFRWHWWGKIKMNFNPHLEVMIPCIRYGESFDSKIPQNELHKIKKGIARRLTNITGELVPPSRMNVRVEPKTTLKQVLHGIWYQVRSTINFRGLMKASKAVKQFMIDGRHNKKQVRYKGKTWSTEIAGWYKYLGFDYNTRNKTKNQEWVDDQDVKYKFVNSHNKWTLINKLRELGTDLRHLSRVSFCINDPKTVNQKINEIVLSGLQSNNNKLVVETICRLKDFNPYSFKMNWTNEVIILALNRKNYMIENESITTDICQQRIKYIKSMDKKDREHWLAIVTEDESENVKSGFPAKTTNLILRR